MPYFGVFAEHAAVIRLPIDCMHALEPVSFDIKSCRSAMFCGSII